MFTLSISVPEDIPALLPVINAAYRGEPSRQGWTTEADFLEGDIRTDAEDLLELMGRPGAIILNVRDNSGNVCGCVFLENREGRLYLGMLSVLPTRQGHGLGKQLLAGAEAHALATGCTAVFMQVISLRKELIAWYERHGYRPTGERKPFLSPAKFGVPRMPLEFVILEKNLRDSR